MQVVALWVFCLLLCVRGWPGGDSCAEAILVSSGGGRVKEALPLLREWPPKRRKKKRKKRVFLTPLILDNEYGSYQSMYYGLNNQRYALVNLLLTAAALRTSVLLPPPVMFLPWDHRRYKEATFDGAWQSLPSTYEKTTKRRFGNFSQLWDLEKVTKFADLIGVDLFISNATTGDCPNYDTAFRHVILPFRRTPRNSSSSIDDLFYDDLLDDDARFGSPEEYKLVTEDWPRWATAMDQDQRTYKKKATVYHAQLSMDAFDSLQYCKDILPATLCALAFEAIATAPTITSASNKILERLPGNHANAVHYHDYFFRVREAVGHHLQAHRANHNDFNYNIGWPPSRVKGVSMADLDARGRFHRPFQVNAAVEFDIALKVNGTFFGSRCSTFDRWANYFRQTRFEQQQQLLLRVEPTPENLRLNHTFLRFNHTFLLPCQHDDWQQVATAPGATTKQQPGEEFK